MRLLAEIVRRFLGLILLYAALGKILHLQSFLMALSSYVVVPQGAERYIALVVIVLELWCGFCLLCGQWLRNTLASALVLLSVYTVVLVINYIHNPSMACGGVFTVTLGPGDQINIVNHLSMAVVTFLLWREKVAA